MREIILAGNYVLQMIFGLAGGAFLYLSLERLIPVKEKWYCRVAVYFVCWLMNSMIIFIGDWVNLPPTLGVFLLAVWWCCRGSRSKRLTVGLMLASVVFAFNGLCDNSFNYIVSVIPEDVYFGGTLRFLFALLLYLWLRRRSPEPDFELSDTLWKLLFLLTLSPVGIEFALVLFRNPDSRLEETILSDTALLLIAFFAFVGLLWAMLALERQQQLEQEFVLAQHHQKYYEALEQQQFETRRLKHDLANHLQILRALPEDEKNHYIDGMIENPAFSKVLAYCGDSTVNAVLTAKESRMRQEGIRFYAKVEIAQELWMERADICALFANALDNAVEACEKMPEGQREISLEARQGKGLLAVKIKNSCENSKADVTADLPKTTKKDTANHGFGLRSIREVVKKYGGHMEISREGEQFTLFFYLPKEGAAAGKFVEKAL